MIRKELESLVNEEFLNRNAKKGYESERQMAFYLHRKFFENQDIHVLNNLYIKTLDGKGFFQIDHLIITKYCFVIVESKTCNSHLRFDKNLQWSCFQQTNNKWIGTKSPMVQAEMQGDALRSVLQENRVALRSHFLNKQGGFLTMPIHTLVAISDSGIIDYSTSNEEYCKNVLKADLIPGRILEIYDSYKNRDTVKNFLLDKDPGYVLPAEDLEKTVQYIISLHHVKPVYRKIEEVQVPACEACKETYSIGYNNTLKQYELLCKGCGSVKQMNYKCSKCNGNLKIHKLNETYVVGCENCDSYGKMIG
ncbi:Nuclease-related domain-containing protein [Fibrobacter sp. UWH9]|uniref:nuclease-related domain-containing protein n=1 Tax=Fibrobacter sp. UWH9 TaxID=1896213 RepID=UPI00091D99CD|nr:nuclease-related domain-containing protein [Fibrobacter sp. UWH9]SHH79136.1 Nuclease-related domain-containing protein [Fibrobacter sp. UWH9]